MIHPRRNSIVRSRWILAEICGGSYGAAIGSDSSDAITGTAFPGDIPTAATASASCSSLFTPDFSSHLFRYSTTGNKALFEKNKTLGKQIQIFANKPHTTYYVATIVNAPLADRRDFVEAYKKTLGSRNYDDFVNRAHEELAKDYFNELTIQLRAQMQYEIVARDEDRKSFD